MLLVSETEETAIDWFPDQRVPIIGLEHFPSDLDVLVATSWSTAFRVAVLPAHHKFYFVQSDETRFHPHDSAWEHITRLSYAIGFNYLTEARWIRQWLLDGFGHTAELVPNGLDPSIFFPTDPLEPKGAKPRILLEGAIGLAYKGMAEAFEAVRDIDAEVWCVSSYGKPEKTWKCHRFFEQVPMTEMRRIYSSCDILVKLSRVEGFFGPPMEMMACGGAVVVGKVTGYDEYIEEGVNALVVDPLQPQQAATAIRRLIEDAALRERLLANGRLTAERWQWEPSIDLLEQYYRDVVQGTRGIACATAKKDLARSVAYFYGALCGVRCEETSTDAETTAEPLAGDHAAQTPASQDPRHFDPTLQESGATDKLLSWLRRKIWFRRFALTAWQMYQRYLAIKARW